jgi:hypothetical protein
MNKLIVTDVGFKTWELVYSFKVETSKGVIIVPQGSTTDGASVPRCLWSFIPPIGRYFKAAVVHDYLYYSHKFDRKTSDLIFYELMLRYDTYIWKAKLMYIAVRLFGRKGYNKYNEAKK